MFIFFVVNTSYFSNNESWNGLLRKASVNYRTYLNSQIRFPIIIENKFKKQKHSYLKCCIMT